MSESRRGPGQPPIADRVKRLTLRADGAVLDILREAAESRGVTLSAYCREVLYARAKILADGIAPG
jgi:predicted HicB family RNase H-like nuclease